MGVKKNDTTTVRIYKNVLPYLNRLSSNAEKTQVEYLSQTLKFLNKTGIDVFAKELIDIPSLIKNLDNRMVSFLKKREQDFFNPMFETYKLQVDLFKKVAIGLQNFDVIDFAISKENEKKKSSKNDLIIPDNLDHNKANFKQEKTTEITREFESNNSLDLERINAEKEDLKNENKIYRKELNFLLKNIRKGSALSGVKFVIDIQENDKKRIENLLNN